MTETSISPGKHGVMSKFNILVVDDDNELAANLKDILDEEGYAATTAPDGQTALELINGTAFNLAIIDHRLPDIGGLDLVEELARLTPETEAIIITGFASLDSAMAAVAHRKIIAYQTKPLNMGQLLPIVRSVAERQMIERSLKESEGRYRLLAENVDDVIWTTDMGLRFTYISPSIKALRGYSSEETISQTIEDILTPASFNVVREAIASALTEMCEPRVKGADSQIRELEVTHRNGSIIPTETRWRFLFDQDKKPAGILGVTRDITERRKAEGALRESEARLRLLLDRAPCILWTTDIGLKYTSMQGTGLAAMNLPSEVVGLTVAEHDNSDDPDSIVMVAHQRALMGISTTYETDISSRTFYSHVEALRNAEGEITGVIGVAFDISERKRAEAELRALSRRLVEIQENERRAIARELHDQIGQYLTALKIQLDRAARSPAENVIRLGEAQELANELIARVRTMSLDLRPSILDDLGLLPALLWHMERYTTLTSVKVHFEHAGLGKHLPPDISTAAYRLVQEALTNVARHASISEARVRVWVDGGALCVQIEDSGKGFDPSHLAIGSSTGLNGMRERALLLGGKLAIETAPGSGVRVMAELPLLAWTEERRKRKRK